MSFAIPVRRLRETSTLVAFNHPKSTFPVHILLVPKIALAGLEALSREDGGFYVDLFDTVQCLVIEMRLEAKGYRLIANGGGYQDVPQLHFHLIGGSKDEVEERGI